MDMDTRDMRRSRLVDKRHPEVPSPVTLEVADGVFSRLRGLLGKRDYRGTLLLTRCNDIHTFGMGEPIDVAFVAHDGRVTASYCRVPPRCRLRSADAVATLERRSSPDPWFDCGDSISGLKVSIR